MIADNVDPVQGTEICIESFLYGHLYASSKSQIMVPRERGKKAATSGLSLADGSAFLPRPQEDV